MERGDRLFRTGDVLSSIFVVRDGGFKTVVLRENGEEQVLGFHLPGDLVGLDAVGLGNHRCDAVALTSTNVCEIRFEDLAGASADLPSLHKQLLRLIGQHSNRDQDHMAILVRPQANERIALFLLNVAGRYRLALFPVHAFKLPMSRGDIARYMGLASETVSRGFSRLQDDGVIALQGRVVTILNAGALGRLAQHEEMIEPPRHNERRVACIHGAV